MEIDQASTQRFILKGTQFVNQLDNFFNNAPAGIAATLAKDYTQAVERNIVTQKFAGGWPEYNIEYKKWKISQVGHEMFWLLFGNIIYALGIWKSALEGYEGGIPPGATVRVGEPKNIGKSLAKIAYWLEFGEPPQKERPLFRQTFAEFRSEAIAIVKSNMAGALKLFWQGPVK